MARQKGKSRRRKKDWQSRYEAGEPVEDAAGRGQTMSRREVKLREDSFAERSAEDADGERVEGMIVGLFRGGALVRVAGRELPCGIAKTYRAPEGSTPLAVGDQVAVGLVDPSHFDGDREADKDRADGMILSRRPRHSALCRPRPWSGKRRETYGTTIPEKVIAANMDVLLVVCATRQPPLRRALIDRFLIVAERGELKPLIVLNKTDLSPAEEELIAELRELGLTVHAVSALKGAGLEPLREDLVGKRGVLAGASGVGKTTLINALIPGTAAETRGVREKDQRGRHTTTAAVVYDLPGGGLIVDTPGVRELGMKLDPAELPWYFPEFEAMASECRFNDCTHTHEPGCAVIAAVEAGRIPPRRYESYLRILDSLE